MPQLDVFDNHDNMQRPDQHPPTESLKQAKLAWANVLNEEKLEHARRTTTVNKVHTSPDFETAFLDAWAMVESHDTLYEHYAQVFCRNDREAIQKTLHELWILVGNLNVVRRSFIARTRFQETYDVVERVLVALQGHWQPQAREKAIRMINVLYDGVDWQRDNPFTVVVKSVGDDFVVTTRVMSRVSHGNDGGTLKMLVSAPSFDCASSNDSVVTWHSVTVLDDGSSENRVTSKVQHGGGLTVAHTSHTVQIHLNSFPRAGFYDWRLVFISPDGLVRPLRFAGRPRSPFEQHIFDGTGMAQGRFVVHPTLSFMHEVLVDLEGVELVRVEGGQNVVTRRGKFDAVQTALDRYADRQVKLINLVGALERDNGCPYSAIRKNSPAQFRGQSNGQVGGDGATTDADSEDGGFGIGIMDVASMSNGSVASSQVLDECQRPEASPTAITDRCIPNHMLGGPRAFRSLVEQASEREIKVSVPLPAYVSSARYARKYDKLLCYTLDSEANRVVHRGTDCRENQWEDTVMLNYRKLATWDVLVNDALELVDLYDVSGFSLVDAQSWPHVLSCDLEELFSVQPNGDYMYSPVEVLEGEIVLSNQEHGYWAQSTLSTVTSYANPLLVKLCRAVWSKHPNVSFFGDSAWGRCRVLACSGVLPRGVDFAIALANVHGRDMSKNGVVVSLPEGSPCNNVAPLYNYIDYLQTLPHGVAALQPISACSPSIPYPALLFGRGVWNMVDLIAMLPGTPMTFVGEEEGKSYRVDLSNTYSHNLAWEEEEARRLHQLKRKSERSQSIAPSSAHSMARINAKSALQNGVGARSMMMNGAGPASSSSGLGTPTKKPSMGTPLKSASKDAGAFGKGHSLALHMLESKLSSDALGDGVNEVSAYSDENRFFFKETWYDESQGDTSLNVQSVPNVRSWANMQSARFNGTHGSVAPGLPPRVQSIGTFDTLSHPQDLDQLEREHKRNIGPQFGFDLGKIGDHYAHRLMLRNKYTVLREGHTIPLKVYHRYGEHPNVLSFARWIPFNANDPARPDKDMAQEIVVVAINFNSHASMFTIDCSSLAKAFGVNDQDEADISRPNVVYTMTDILESSDDDDDDKARPEMYTPREAASSSNLVTLAAHRALAWRFVCKPLQKSLGQRSMPRSSTNIHLNAMAKQSPSEAFVSPLFPLPSSVTDLERKFFRGTLGRLYNLLTDHEKALSRKQSNLDRISGSDGALPDVQLAEAGANNHVFANLKRSFEKCVKRLDEFVFRQTTSAETSREDLADRLKGFWQSLLDRMLSDLKVDDDDHGNDDSALESLQQDMEYAALPLSQAFHLLVIQVLPRQRRDGDDESITMVSKGDEYLDVPMASNDENLTDIVVRALAPIIRKVLFTVTRLVHHIEDAERILVAFLKLISKLSDSSEGSSPYATALAKAILESNELGEVVFIAPELGKWSTVGGLGVMVDELTIGLAALGVRVTVISPFYDQNRKGHKDYLRPDGIHWRRNITTHVGPDPVELGLHEGFVNGVRVIFLHNATYFPYPYPNGNAWQTLRILILMAKSSLEAMCQLRLIPGMIVTNDWFTGLVAAYAKSGSFGSPSVFSNTFFFHIIHNLDPSYEGRIHVDVAELAAMNHLHGLPPDLLLDPFWAPVNHEVLLNPSRAALLCSDTWGTVSPSYRDDLLSSSPLATLLKKAPHPFAYVNGIPTIARAEKLERLETNTHELAKGLLQQRYFGYEKPDLGIPMFAFVGRITRQKGVHLILSVAATMIEQCNGRVQFLVGGPANVAEKYSADCVHQMRSLRAKYPNSFWADPDLFFTDGPMVNLGADFGLMPSLFEPSGIVQQEFFIGGTPVIAFLTGGLKDTVFEFNHATLTGNGFTFQAHSHGDFLYAIQRAIDTFTVEHLYAVLRANAKASVLDLASVCFAWYKEFKRCRRCLVGGSPTLMRCPTSDGGDHEVFVCGSFTDWKNVALEKDELSGEYEKVFHLPDGIYKYHFVIDGAETLATGVPVSRMRDGTEKHVVLVRSTC